MAFEEVAQGWRNDSNMPGTWPDWVGPITAERGEAPESVFSYRGGYTLLRWSKTRRWTLHDDRGRETAHSEPNGEFFPMAWLSEVAAPICVPWPAHEPDAAKVSARLLQEAAAGQSNPKGHPMAKSKGGAVDENVKISKSRRSLRCEFSEDEQREMGLELAREGAAEEEAEERKKEIDSQLKADIEKHHTAAAAIRRRLNNGYEYRDVPVTITRDFNAGTYSEVRDDLEFEIESRTLTAEERQIPLVDEPSGDLPE